MITKTWFASLLDGQTTPSAPPPHGPAVIEPRKAMSPATAFDATISLPVIALPKLSR